MIETNIPCLKIEDNEDGTLTLEQDWSGNIDRVTVHAIHLRFMAESLGLVREPSTSEADALRTVATLKRRLHTLKHRIDKLDDWIREAEARGRDDLSLESTYSFATWELATEFCEDLDQLAPCNATKRHKTPAPETQKEPGGNPRVTQTEPSANPAVSVGAAAQLELEAS